MFTLLMNAVKYQLPQPLWNCPENYSLQLQPAQHQFCILVRSFAKQTQYTVVSWLRTLFRSKYVTLEIRMLRIKRDVATRAAVVLWTSHSILWHGLNVWIVNDNVDKGQGIAEYFMIDMTKTFLTRENHPVSEIHRISWLKWIPVHSSHY